MDKILSPGLISSISGINFSRPVTDSYFGDINIPDRYKCDTIQGFFIDIDEENDLIKINSYKDLCDFFLLDAKPNDNEMPGGNAKSFDWDILINQKLEKEFFLSGGLDIYNLEIALKNNITSFFDVSSSVESSPGVKDKAKIKEFIGKVKNL